MGERVGQPPRAGLPYQRFIRLTLEQALGAEK